MMEMVMIYVLEWWYEYIEWIVLESFKLNKKVTMAETCSVYREFNLLFVLLIDVEFDV